MQTTEFHEQTNNKTISVVICAYNEERTVGAVLEKLKIKAPILGPLS